VPVAVRRAGTLDLAREFAEPIYRERA